MGYVDLQQRRREELAREKRGRRSLWQDDRNNPYLNLGVGFILGVLASWPIIATPDGYTPFVAHLPMILIVLSGFGVWRIRRDRAKGVEPRFGGEKQLLAAIQSAGGTMTPVEAALETSLTVDEAQDILTRLADHGPLFVEGRDGVLSYVLPGGRARGRGGA